MRTFFALRAIVTICVLFTLTRAQKPEVGAVFPQQQFPALTADGRLSEQLQSVRQYLGKKVLLIQFASW